ncbi:hypothetical protein FKM82_021863 [Ascaphus truei]
MANCNKKEIKVISQILNATRCTIAKNWKQPTPPFLNQINNKIWHIVYMEKLTAYQTGSTSQFSETWAPWFRHAGLSPYLD